MKGSQWLSEPKIRDLRSLYVVDPDRGLRPFSGIVPQSFLLPHEKLFKPDCGRSAWDHELPLECWECILLKLGPCSLLTIALTCQHLCALAREERVWLRHSQRVAQAFQLRNGRWSVIGDPLWNVFRCMFLQSMLRTGFDGKACRLISLWDQSGGAEPLTFSWTSGADYRVVLTVKPTADATSSIAMRFTKTYDGPAFSINDVRLEAPYELRISNTIDPRLWERFHSIVRDTDCVGLRNVGGWAWIVK